MASTTRALDRNRQIFQMIRMTSAVIEYCFVIAKNLGSKGCILEEFHLGRLFVGSFVLGLLLQPYAL